MICVKLDFHYIFQPKQHNRVNIKGNEHPASSINLDYERFIKIRSLFLLNFYLENIFIKRCVIYVNVCSELNCVPLKNTCSKFQPLHSVNIILFGNRAFHRYN